MPFIEVKDLTGKEWILNTDVISHVEPVSGDWKHGGTIYLKTEITDGRKAINVPDKRIKKFIKELLG